MRFYSKKGKFLGGIIWGSFLFMILSLFFLPGKPEETSAFLIAILIYGAVGAFLAWLWFGTYYDIKADFIKIVSGPFRSKVDIMKITSIRRTRNLLSSPALSIDRLEIKSGKWDFVLISPIDEERFCEILCEKNSKIVVELPKKRK